MRNFTWLVGVDATIGRPCAPQRLRKGGERPNAWLSRSWSDVHRSNAIASIRVLGEERAIVLGATEGPRVAGKRNNGERTKDGIDGRG
jgi:hypothetical protein